jgi:hypothetical protein
MSPINISKGDIKLLNYQNKFIPYIFIENQFHVEILETLALVTNTPQTYRLTAAIEKGEVTFILDERPKQNFVTLETAKKLLLQVVAKNDLDFDIENFYKTLYNKEGLIYKTFQDIEKELLETTERLETLENLYQSKVEKSENLSSKLLAVCEINESLNNELNDLKTANEAIEGLKNSLLDNSKILEDTTKEAKEKLEKLEQDAKEKAGKIELLEKENAEKAFLVEQFENLKTELNEKTLLEIKGEKIEKFFISRFLPYFGFLALFGVMAVFSWFVLIRFVHLNLEYDWLENTIVGVLALSFAIVFELSMMIFSLKNMIFSKWVLLFAQFFMVGLKTSIFLPSFYQFGDETPNIVFAWLLSLLLPFLQFSLSEIIRKKI